MRQHTRLSRATTQLELQNLEMHVRSFRNTAQWSQDLKTEKILNFLILDDTNFDLS